MDNITTETLGHGERQKKTLGQDVQDRQDKKTFLPQSSQRSAEKHKASRPQFGVRLIDAAFRTRSLDKY